MNSLRFSATGATALSHAHTQAMGSPTARSGTDKQVTQALHKDSLAN